MSGSKKHFLGAATLFNSFFSMILVVRMFFLISKILKMLPKIGILFVTILGLVLGAYVGVFIAFQLCEKWDLLLRASNKKHIVHHIDQSI